MAVSALQSTQSTPVASPVRLVKTNHPHAQTTYRHPHHFRGHSAPLGWAPFALRISAAALGLVLSAWFKSLRLLQLAVSFSSLSLHSFPSPRHHIHSSAFLGARCYSACHLDPCPPPLPVRSLGVTSAHCPATPQQTLLHTTTTQYFFFFSSTNRNHGKSR